MLTVYAPTMFMSSWTVQKWNGQYIVTTGEWNVWLKHNECTSEIDNYFVVYEVKKAASLKIQ